MRSNGLKPNGLDYCLCIFKIPLIEECQINSFDGDRAPTHLNDFDQSCISFLRNVTGHPSKNATGHSRVQIFCPTFSAPLYALPIKTCHMFT